MDFRIGFVDPSNINNVEFCSPIINANETIVLTKWNLYGVFDFVEQGVRRNSVGNADKAMFRVFKDFVFKEIFEIVIVHFRGNDVRFRESRETGVWKGAFENAEDVAMNAWSSKAAGCRIINFEFQTLHP